ncbi:MAG: hypothetical protein ABID67_00310 [Candidatus Nealsonbacteria bacterium]
MKTPDKTYILILLIVILGLSLTSYWRFNDFNKSLSEINLPEINFPETNLEDFLQTEEDYQEWISPDERLKLRYSTKWKSTNDFLSLASDQIEVSDILFSAYQLKVKEQTLVFLTINEFNSKKTLEEIIEKIEQDAEEQDGKIEIINVENEEEIAWIEISSKRSGSPDFYSKGKFIFDKEKTYLIIFTTQQVYWSKFKEEANKILNSMELL